HLEGGDGGAHARVPRIRGDHLRAQLQLELTIGVGGEDGLAHVVGVGVVPVPADAGHADGVLDRGGGARGPLADGPAVADADVVAVGEERQPQGLTALEGDAATGAHREGRVRVEAGVRVGRVHHHAVPRVAGVTDAVAVVVTLVGVLVQLAVVLAVEHAVVFDVLFAGITDAVVVGVLLVAVGNGGAVVASVVHAVTVGVHHALHTGDGGGVGRVGVARAVVLGVGNAVAIVVSVAGVTLAVTVGVSLVRVVDAGAVVGGVQHVVAVLVRVAGITLAVAIGVALVGVGDGGAVVAGVAHAVAVAVGLVTVGDEGAVVEAVGLAVTVGIVGVRQRLAVVGVAHPHRTAAATAAAAAFLHRRTALGTETFGVVTVLRQPRRGPREREADHQRSDQSNVLHLSNPFRRSEGAREQKPRRSSGPEEPAVSPVGCRAARGPDRVGVG